MSRLLERCWGVACFANDWHFFASQDSPVWLEYMFTNGYKPLLRYEFSMNWQNKMEKKKKSNAILRLSEGRRRKSILPSVSKIKTAKAGLKTRKRQKRILSEHKSHKSNEYIQKNSKNREQGQACWMGQRVVYKTIFVATQKIPPQSPQNGLGCRCTKGLRVGRYLFETSPETSPKHKIPTPTLPKGGKKEKEWGKIHFGGIFGEVWKLYPPRAERPIYRRFGPFWGGWGGIFASSSFFMRKIIPIYKRIAFRDQNLCFRTPKGDLLQVKSIAFTTQSGT